MTFYTVATSGSNPNLTRRVRLNESLPDGGYILARGCYSADDHERAESAPNVLICASKVQLRGLYVVVVPGMPALARPSFSQVAQIRVSGQLLA